MSIINQMLLDLDKRKGRSGGEAAVGQAVRSVQPGSPSRSRHTFAAVIFGLALLTLSAGLWLRQRHGAVAATLVAVPTPPVVALSNDPPHGGATPMPQVAQVGQVAPIAPVATVPVATEPASVAKTPAPSVAAPLVAIGASEPTGTAPVATAPAKVVAPTSAVPVAPASAPSASDKVDAPPPTKTAAASLKAAGGKSYSAEQVSGNLLAGAVKLDQQGHQEEAKAPLERLLASNPRARCSLNCSWTRARSNKHGSCSPRASACFPSSRTSPWRLPASGRQRRRRRGDSLPGGGSRRRT